ncbi:hypothetical protein PE067_18775 [Paracoccus sp. DMF-8]|uniref:hypothetical protein n=1 Tax=Paracoccus sp. DMF-8 TaxID=3019445 RepID=UPI0023E39BEF|nr:hypothetical protein [Paracoccus sp. DMF-8]MDF3607990.1 hypothetical protein [Paracoccus sp. DMF-8]
MSDRIDFATDLALTAEGQAPEWVHLLPLGRFVARDGRVFDNSDPDGLSAHGRSICRLTMSIRTTGPRPG